MNDFRHYDATALVFDLLPPFDMLVLREQFPFQQIASMISSHVSIPYVMFDEESRTDFISDTHLVMLQAFST